MHSGGQGQKTNFLFSGSSLMPKTENRSDALLFPPLEGAAEHPL